MVKNSDFNEIMEDAHKPAFYKIFRRECLSSEFMRMIPHDVIRNISNSFSFTMVLKVAWGSLWTVKISKNPDFFYMEDYGWKKFVNDNALVENDYLTFTHEANMCFKVSIFEPEGLEILKPRKSSSIAPGSGLNRSHQRKNFYTDVKEEVMESSDPSLRTVKSEGSRLKIKREVSLEKKKAKETETSKRKKKKEEEEGETSALVPEFNLTLKKSHLMFLGIPKIFLDRYMPKETKEFKIYDLKGKKSWNVLFLVTDKQSRFSAGWSRLAKDLGLKVGDVCNFKLIETTEMVLKIYR